MRYDPVVRNFLQLKSINRRKRKQGLRKRRHLRLKRKRAKGKSTPSSNINFHNSTQKQEKSSKPNSPKTDKEIIELVYKQVCRHLMPFFDREAITMEIIMESRSKGHPKPSSNFIRMRCIDAMRSRSREKRAESGAAVEPERTQEDHGMKNLEDKELVQHFVSVLTPEERKLIWLRFYQAKTLQEIADYLEVPKSQVHIHLTAALYKMQRLI